MSNYESKFKAGDSARFNYLFAGDQNTTMPEYLGREDQTVTLLRDVADYDRDETGPMWVVRFPDGWEASVFEDELSPFTNAVRFRVEFDSEVWTSLSEEERSEWIDKVSDLINSEARVTDIQTNA